MEWPGLLFLKTVGPDSPFALIPNHRGKVSFQDISRGHYRNKGDIIAMTAVKDHEMVRESLTLMFPPPTLLAASRHLPPC
jgi:hypothetical protein